MKIGSVKYQNDVRGLGITLVTYHKESILSIDWWFGYTQIVFSKEISK